MPQPIIEGGTEAAAARFNNWLQKRAKNLQVTREEVARVEIQQIGEDVIAANPKWTGASSGAQGMPQGWRLRWPSHPAHNMVIGNFTNGGDTGWQVGERKVNQYRTDFFLYNPMWDAYLYTVEMGFAHQMNHAIHPGGFVRAAWGRHLARRRSQR